MSSVASYLRIPLIASSGLALVLSGALYFKQNDLVYPRDFPAGARQQKLLPSAFNISSSEEVTITTPDGEKLAAFVIKPTDCIHPRPVTILMFHGNAGNISQRLPIAAVLESRVGCNVVMVEYRGYGQSTGNPSEKGIQIDAQAALDFILSRPDLRETNIVLYGQSLGGAVAVYLASKHAEANTIKGLIVENTFLSIRKMIPNAFPPAKYLAALCHEVWPSETAMPKIRNTPVLFLSGRKDEIVPSAHMDQLYELCKSKVKKMVHFTHGDHNSTVTLSGYFSAMRTFIDKHVCPTIRPSRRQVTEPFRGDDGNAVSSAFDSSQKSGATDESASARTTPETKEAGDDRPDGAR